MSKTVIVITRYNETIDWLRYIIDKADLVYIYNKGLNDNLFVHFDQNAYPEKIIIKKLPNLGRIDHTIAYHIIEHWENLPDTLVFLPASILMCKSKGYYLNAINKNLSFVKTNYFGFYSPRFYKVSKKYNYTIDYYQAEGICNKNNNPFIKSEFPSFQNWKMALIDTRPIRYVAMRGMFAVCKENIKHISKEIYENMLLSLSVGDNIENGHFAERIWAHLFRQYSFDTKVPPPETQQPPETPLLV
jgi:hypothetical protein